MRITRCIAAASLLFLAPVAKAEITFEGIYKIEKNKKHIGYGIQRVELDPTTKKRSIIAYFKTLNGGKTATEVTRSYADESYVPLNSLFTSDKSDIHETITATFGGPTAKVVTRFNKSRKDGRTDNLPANEGTFLSSFLFFILDLAALEQEKAAKNYEAFSEEDGRYAIGKVRFVASKTFAGQKIMQFDDFFVGEGIENFVFADGTPLGARSDFNKINVFLATKADAVMDMDFPQKELTEIFKDLPEGKKNPFAQSDGKLKPLEIVEAFEPVKPDPQLGSEEIPAMDVKVPKRAK